MKFDESMFDKVKKKIRTGYADSKEPSYFQDKITFPANVKYTLARDGAVLIVHDVPITKVGVQPYYDAQGHLERHFKTPEAIQGIKSDFAPMAFTHPGKHFRDMTDEEIRDNMVGWTSDGRFDAETQRRFADLYFTVSELNKDTRGRELLERVKAGKSTDVSIGFFVDTVRESGTYDGKAYDVKQVGIDYDHLAVLVDEQGRYSFPDRIGIGADSENNGGKSMGEPANTQSPAAADVLAGQLRDAEKARQDAEARAKAAAEDAEKTRKDLEAFKADAAKREADEHIKRVDAFVKRLQAKSLDKKADMKEWAEFLNRLKSDQMTFLEKSLGDAILVKDNRISFMAGSNDSSAAEVDFFKQARDGAMSSWKKQNGIQEKQ
jgi:hypothetical protein